MDQREKKSFQHPMSVAVLLFRRVCQCNKYIQKATRLPHIVSTYTPKSGLELTIQKYCKTSLHLCPTANWRITTRLRFLLRTEYFRELWLWKRISWRDYSGLILISGFFLFHSQICRSVPVQGFIETAVASSSISKHRLVLRWRMVLSCMKYSKRLFVGCFRRSKKKKKKKKKNNKQTKKNNKQKKQTNKQKTQRNNNNKQKDPGVFFSGGPKCVCYFRRSKIIFPKWDIAATGFVYQKQW